MEQQSVSERAAEVLESMGMMPVKDFLKAIDVKSADAAKVLPFQGRTKGKTPLVGFTSLNLAEWEERMGIPSNMRHFE